MSPNETRYSPVSSRLSFSGDVQDGNANTPFIEKENDLSSLRIEQRRFHSNRVLGPLSVLLFTLSAILFVVAYLKQPGTMQCVELLNMYCKWFPLWELGLKSTNQSRHRDWSFTKAITNYNLLSQPQWMKPSNTPNIISITSSATKPSIEAPQRSSWKTTGRLSGFVNHPFLLHAHAWQSIVGEANIPAEGIQFLDKDRPEVEWKRLPAEDGGGYAATFMVFHQLHCLVSPACCSSVLSGASNALLENLIRQYTWGDFYARHNMSIPLRSSAVGNRMHVDHCIEELRLTFMCMGDTTPLLVEIDPTAPIGEKSDFNARHRCRNYDKLARWMEDNVVVRWPAINWSMNTHTADNRSRISKLSRVWI